MPLTATAGVAASTVPLDANEAVARVAYRLNEVIALYPITPASPIGEWADQAAHHGQPNLWGDVPAVIEMQSEAGAAGTVHGALQTGALATTFTASQGLLLMLPNLFKIAGELLPCVIHVAARSVATHALSIFGDHSDVMAVRSAGWALLCAGSVQEAQDLAAIAQAASLRARIPVLHFFDGFRTSHEIQSIQPLDDETLRALIPDDAIRAHRARALDPEHPVLRGTSQNPDVFFQSREAQNGFHAAFAEHLRAAMGQFAALTGRSYANCSYTGHPHAERIVVAMGSGASSVAATVEALAARGEAVGAVTVRLFRPFPASEFLALLPRTVRSIAVLDRTKEPGATGEPLWQEVVGALATAPPDAPRPRVIGGRYGLASKEFTPAMVAAVCAELARPAPRHSFTVGILDDLGGSSLPVDESFRLPAGDTFQAVFFGLGADGTVGANKSTIKILGAEADRHVQGYFVYDSKKAGAMTVSHLRAGSAPIRAAWLIEPDSAEFVAVHHLPLLQRHDVLRFAAPGATLLLNAPGAPAEVFAALPVAVQHEIRRKRLRVFAIDAQALAREHGLGRTVNTIMQAGFFQLTDLLPAEVALAAMRHAIEASYGKRGGDIVARNLAAVRAAAASLREVAVPAAAAMPVATAEPLSWLADGAPPFVRDVTAVLMRGEGDLLPTSALPVDGTYPTGTAQFERRALADQLPVWDPQLCIQCGKCALVCPHAAIRTRLVHPDALAGAPDGFLHVAFKGTEHPGHELSIQVAPDDCTGCELCVVVCPGRDKSEPRRKSLAMQPAAARRDAERPRWEFFRALPDPERATLVPDTVREAQLLPPLFEFSGACAGCGETPYLKLLSQLFGDRLLVANATGCSSIYGGNLPTTPWTKDRDGRGPAWANSLFEDAAEFGLGFRLALDQQREAALRMLLELRPLLAPALADALLATPAKDPAGVARQRVLVEELRQQLRTCADPTAARLSAVAGALLPKSTWVVGGDGWAYDIGFGGLDHALASQREIKLLVLDTEVYSNTGGQMSKATPRAAVAKFASAGKGSAKKDIGRIAMAHGHVYVAQVAFGANDRQCVRAFLEAESFDGPALILAYSPCIAHGIAMAEGLEQQKLAVQSGHWPLYRFDPRRADAGAPALQLDSRAPSVPFMRFAERESRFQMLRRGEPELAKRLFAQAQQDIDERWRALAQLAGGNGGEA